MCIHIRYIPYTFFQPQPHLKKVWLILKMARKINRKDMLEVWNIDSLRYTISLPLYLIFLLLLWHWNYPTAFWIFLALIVIEYVIVIYQMNKTKIKLFK